MRKLFKILGKIAGILAGLYALLFAVFYFDLDGKLLYYVVEPFVCKHYDRMERQDVTKRAYRGGWAKGPSGNFPEGPLLRFRTKCRGAYPIGISTPAFSLDLLFSVRAAGRCTNPERRRCFPGENVSASRSFRRTPGAAPR